MFNSLHRAFPSRHPASPSTSKPRPFTFIPSTAPTKPNPCAQMSSMDFCIIQHLRPFMCCWPFAELWLEEPPPRPRRKHRKRRSGAKHTSDERVEVKVSELQRRSFLIWFATARRACECGISPGPGHNFTSLHYWICRLSLGSTWVRSRRLDIHWSHQHLTYTYPHQHR